MILAIDGNNMAHRVFHTNQGALTTKDGTPSGVLIGVIKAIKAVLERFPETNRAIVLWDGGRSKWRKELYPDYKAQRDYGSDDAEKKKAYEGLWTQMEELHNMLSVIGVHSIKVQGYEADDLIALTSKYVANNTDEHVMVVSSDKDMLQLVSDSTSVYSPYKDKVYSPLNFYEELGVTQKAFIGYRALVGDTSDNIRGIQGVGEKTAKKWMDKYGHIDNMLGAQGDDKKKLLKSKVSSRIFTPEGLKTLAINNKIMSFKFVPENDEVNNLVRTNVSGPGLSVDSTVFKAWLIKWQFASILANYMPFITPFLALGDDD